MLRDKAIFLFLVSSGVRATELLNLNVQDVDTITGRAKVISGKGDKNRLTFINKEARKALRKYLQTHPANIEAIWLNDEGERITKSAIDHILVKYSKLAGISTVGAHDFRRCFALNCYRQGMEILIISKLLGHSSVEITKRYLDIGENDLKRDYDKLNF